MAELKVPEALLVNVTVPVGVMLVPDDVSVAVAVHVVCAVTGTDEGVQLMVVLVERWVAVRLKLFELPRCSASPP